MDICVIIKKQIKMNEITGLERQANQKIAEKLNELLANYEVYYQNLRGFQVAEFPEPRQVE